jgi:hypothetical protein
MARLRLLFAAVMLGTIMLAPATVQAAKAAPTFDVTTTALVDGAANTFAGSLTIDRFARQGGQIVAIGSLDGILTNTLTGVTTTLADVAVTFPIGLTGTCDILHLELGPLDLNLLGLVIHLDKIVLDITAESGPGNLLGNLLCAIAGLLDGGGPLNQLVALLNQILRILG